MNIAQSYEHAAAFITALTGDVATPMAWRAISDIKGDGREPKIWFAPLATVWNDLVQYNSARYGIFAIINATDGLGREAQNVTAMRAAWVDLDKGDVAASRARALAWPVKPTMLVNSSATGKAHAYWLVEPYNDPVQFSELQRKLIATFDGDVTINDPPRVMRIPGFLHQKSNVGEPLGSPWLVTLEAGPAWGSRIPVSMLAGTLSGVVVGAGGVGVEALGAPHLAAPSFEWATRALDAIDPSGLSYDEWRDITFAFKQAIWSHTNEFVAKTVWDAWNRRSSKYEYHESEKLWRSAKAPRAGWPMLVKRSGMQAQVMFGQPPKPGVLPVPSGGGEAPPVTPAPGGGDPLGAFLSPEDQAVYFKGCTYVVSLGRILTPKGMFLDPGQFNAVYGGKQFVIKPDGAGMTTDEPWKAATRGQLFKVPQVEFTRFLPAMPIDRPIVDEFGNLAINTYRPARIAMREGDPTPFVNHIRAILPTEGDVGVYLAYLAHCVQRPGVKAKWAPLIQSTEGAGKGLIALVMTHAVGRAFTHSVNARELGEGGGKFNGWMEGKLLIIADEIRVDDRRDMIEVLKPMITDATIEIQRKGVDQIIGDNVSNWLMFSNYKDAIPITNNSRRFAIFYSPMQTKADLIRAGMGSNYFGNLFGWLEAGGYEIVAHYLKHYVIPVDLDPAGMALTAPETSSHAEALIESRGQYEQRIADAVAEGKQGFRGGWVSSWQVSKLLGGKVGPRTVAKAIEALGYVAVGRSTTAILMEDMSKPTLYSLDPHANLAGYPVAQGYAS